MTLSKPARLTSLAAALAAVLGLAALPAVPATAATPTSGSLAASPTHGPVSSFVILTGRAGPRSAHPVRLQGEMAGRWLTILKGATTRAGRFRFRVAIPASPFAEQSYRVLTPKHGKVKASVTPVATVTIDRAPSDPAIRLLSQGDDLEHGAGVISGDGRYVVDLANGPALRDLETGHVIKSPAAGQVVDVSDDGHVVLLAAAHPIAWYPKSGVTVELDGEDAWSISGDGRYVLASMPGGTLVVEDLSGATPTTPVGHGTGGDLSYDGRYVATAGSEGELLVDRSTGAVVDLTPAGANLVDFPSVSDDGRYVVAWVMLADGFSGLYLFDALGGGSQTLPLDGDYGDRSQVSDDGQRVVFTRGNSASGIEDAVVWTPATDAVRNLTNGTAAGAWGYVTVTDDGSTAAVATSAALDPNDTDDTGDLYLVDLALLR